MKDENDNWIECCVKGCFRAPVSLGLCVNHWRRNKTYGSPVASRMHAGMFMGRPPEERFWMQVRKADGDKCWNWKTGADADGYGAFKGEIGGVVYQRAHRFSFALHFGHPPKGMHVCHRCDNPRCVRPDHLFIGSPLENMQDKIAKGRAQTPFGERASQAILTEEQAIAILSDPRPHAQIGADYGVHAGTISSLKTRVSWPHLGPQKGVKAKRVSPRKGVSDKITPDIVREIRTSTERGCDLARKFDTTQQTITDIRKRRSWAHVED